MMKLQKGAASKAAAGSQSLCDLQVRDSTAEAKAQFDTAELSLQNLLYEKGHYLKEIRACQSFRCLPDVPHRPHS